MVEKFKRDLMRRGVGDAMIVKTLTVLQSVLSYAVACGELDANPVREVRKPSQRPKRVVRPLSPEQVEAIRAELKLRDATIVSVLGVLGAAADGGAEARWQDVRERTLVIEPANSKTRRGRGRSSCSHRSSRTWREWRLSQGRLVKPTAPVFPRSTAASGPRPTTELAPAHLQAGGRRARAAGASRTRCATAS